LFCLLFISIKSNFETGAGTSGATVLADFCPVADDYIGNVTTQKGENNAWTTYYLKCEGKKQTNTKQTKTRKQTRAHTHVCSFVIKTNTGTPPAEDTYIQLQNATLFVQQQLEQAIKDNNTVLIEDLTTVLNLFLDINDSLVSAF
jgi:hypothetical protein